MNLVREVLQVSRPILAQWRKKYPNRSAPFYFLFNTLKKIRVNGFNISNHPSSRDGYKKSRLHKVVVYQLYKANRPILRRWMQKHYYIYILVMPVLLLITLFLFFVFLPIRIFKSIKNKLIPPSEKKEGNAEISQIIKTLTEIPAASEKVIISFVGASRWFENPNNRLAEFLRSIISTTEKLERVEVVVRIDDDDDLSYFSQIYEEFNSVLRIRYVIGHRQGGYKGLHALVSETLPHIAPSSKVVFGFADDCLMNVKNWDSFFVTVSHQYSDNIFFINTLRDFSIPYQDKYLFFWDLWRYGPPAVFPAISRNVLEVTQEVAKKHPGWTAFGNSCMCDSFFETLQLYIWEYTKEKRVEVLPDTIYAQPDIAVANHKEGGLFSQSPVAVKSYQEFLKNSTQSVIKEMAYEISKKMQMQVSIEKVA